MVMEVAQLAIRPGQEDAFAAAFAKAAPLIRGTAGCRSLDLRRSVESPSRFVLLVEWDSVDAHMKGIVDSPTGAEIGGLISGYLAAEPLVEHTESILTA